MIMFIKNIFTLIFIVIGIIIFGIIGFLLPYAIVGISVMGLVYFFIKEKRIEEAHNKK